VTAVKKAARLVSVRALIQSLNRVEELCGARVTGADGQLTVPVDWMGAMIVADGGYQTPMSAQTAGAIIPYQQEALNALTTLGLSRDDIRKCKSCSRWFLFASRKAEVCPECRHHKWPAKYRKRHRAELNEEAGVKTKRGRRTK
jgi:hypothetical protein